jgi:type IV secretion system protein TrbI
MAMTNLLQPPPILVKRHNKAPLFIAGFVVFILVAAYIIVLAHHAKKEVLTAFQQNFTTSKPLIEAAAPEDTPPHPATIPSATPPPSTTEQPQQDSWEKMQRENTLKWKQMGWDHKLKAADAAFSRSQKLIETRATERQQALRAPSDVDINGKKEKEGLQNPVAALLASHGLPAEERAGANEIAPAMGQPSLTQQPGLQHTSQIATAALLPPVSPFMLRQGTHLPVSLDQWLTSDAQGAWVARVTADVYDSIRSRHLLIPAGSTLFGFSEVAEDTNQQPTLMLAARTLQLPNGQSLDLGRTFGQNGQGIQGVSDEVNRHLFQRYGSTVLLSLITAGIRMASYQGGSSDRFYLSPAEAATQGAGEGLGKAAGEELRRTLHIRPTVTVPLGYNFTVTLVQDYGFTGPYQEER